jgi:hypothetical protein
LELRFDAPTRSTVEIAEVDWHGCSRGDSLLANLEDDHSDGGQRWRCHEVSQWKGSGLQMRGTAAICRMVPPHSGQMAKSAALIW